MATDNRWVKEADKINKKDLGKLVKDRECLHCEKFFDCEGKKLWGALCLHFQERKDTNG